MLRILKKRVKIKDQKEAEKFFEKQKDALQKIAKTDGFKELVRWWEHEYDRLDESLKDLKGTDLLVAIQIRDIIKKNLLWLDAMMEE